MEAYSLFELNEHIRRVLALNFQEALWVRCEISQVKQSRGHYYLELVEKVPEQDEILAQVSAVIWAKTAWILQRKLRDVFQQLLVEGMEVKLKVRVDFHERYGLKLVVDDIDPAFTLGNIEARRREILESLQSLGLLRKNADHALPRVLQRIAVLSAEQAAGFIDFKNHLLHNPFDYRYWVDLYPIAMQGVYVERELVAAMQSIAHAKKHYDCIVIIRGGGSRLDLSAFDSIEIGKAIALAPLPVITGIGHEIDHTVADSVAHTALKTPTAVADFLNGSNHRFDTAVHEMLYEIAQLVRHRVHTDRLQLNHMADTLGRIPRDVAMRQRFMLDQVSTGISVAAKRTLSAAFERIANMEMLLASLDPEAVLKRGFSISTFHDKRIRSSSEVSPGDTITTYLHDGKLQSTIIPNE